MKNIELDTPEGTRLTRRGLFIGTGLVAATLLLGGVIKTDLKRPEIIGTTYSPRYAEKKLGLLPGPTFREILTEGYDRVRLCTYWPEIQPQKGDFYIRDLEGYLEDATKARVQIVLTVGMKAPRYPEFFIPGWVAKDSDITQNSKPLDTDSNLSDNAKDYVLKLVDYFKDHPSIDWIQIENEPFNKVSVANYRYLSTDYIRYLAAEVRKIINGKQKIIITNSVSLNPFSIDEIGKISLSADMADIVGKNVYIKVPDDRGGVFEAGIAYFSQLRAQKMLLSALGTEGIIAESQFEPWMVNDIPLEETLDPEAYSNLVMIMGGMGFREVWIWGCEYAKYQKRIGNPVWDQEIEKVLAA